jgi:hypothetical protein
MKYLLTSTYSVKNCAYNPETHGHIIGLHGMTSAVDFTQTEIRVKWGARLCRYFWQFWFQLLAHNTVAARKYLGHAWLGHADTVAARSKTWTVIALSNPGIVGSDPTRSMDDCVRLFCVCVVLCVGSGLAKCWSPVRGALLTVYRLINWKAAMVQQRAVEPWIDR